MVNLNECSPGDYLISVDGDLFIYVKKGNPRLTYPHLVLRSLYKNRSVMTNEGRYIDKHESGYDIIEIVPQTNSSTPYFELYEKLRLYKRTSSAAQRSDQCVF